MIDVIKSSYFAMAREKNENLVQGIVLETLPSTIFRVQIKKPSKDGASVEEKEILAHLSGKMRIHYIKVMPGDMVLIRVSPDGNRGIVMRRI